MKESFAALFSAAFTVAACWAAGTLLCERIGARLTRAEKFPLAFLVGASLVHLFVFSAFAAHVGFKPVWLISFSALIAAGSWRSGKIAVAAAKSASIHPAVRILFIAISAVFSVLYFVNALAPETSPDGAGYHLEIVSRYVRAHSFFPITSDMYAGLSEGVELIYAPAFALGRHSAAALVHFAFLIALGMSIFAYGRRIGKPLAGAAAALLVYLSPVVGRDGTTAYIDAATAAIVFGAFYFLEIWDEVRGWRLLVPAGLLAGYAYAAKYTAFVILIYAVIFVIWKSRKLSPAVILVSAAILMVAPWMVKDWIYLHNPVAPFANEWFPNPYFHPITIQDWTAYLRRYDISNLWTLPIEDTVRGGKTEGSVGPVFLLVPLALLALRDRSGRRLLGAGGLLFATYFANVGTRFLIPALPFFALAMTIALARPAILLVMLVMAHALASWPAVLPHYSDKYLWRLEKFPWRAAFGIESRESYRENHLWEYKLARAINQKVPAADRILALSGLAGSYVNPEVLQQYESAYSIMLTDFVYTAMYEAQQPNRAVTFRFPERQMRRVRVLQTAQGNGPEQWDVYELRFFDHGREIPRMPAWRLRAHPNPWEVQLAFDNSPVTRWRSGKTLAPGMFIEVNFGRAEPIDEVHLETTAGNAGVVRLRVETGDADRWTLVTDQLAYEPLAYRGSMRRAATAELAARGIHYLLVRDNDWGAADINGDPEAWGLRPIVREQGGILYSVP